MTEQSRPTNVINLSERFPEKFDSSLLLSDETSESMTWNINAIGKALGHEHPFIAADEEGKIIYARILLKDSPQLDQKGKVIFGSIDVFPEVGDVYYHPASGVGMHLLSDIDHISVNEDNVIFHADGETEYEEMTLSRDGVVSIIHAPYPGQALDSIDPREVEKGLRKELHEFYTMKEASRK